MKLSAAEFVFVKVLEGILDFTHDIRYFAFWNFLIWPVSACENFNREFNIFHDITASGFLEVLIKIFGFDHILEHSLDLVYCVVAAFDSKLLYHLLLCFIGQGGLVEKSLGQKVAVLSDEDITTMETTEQSDGRIELLILLLLSNLLEASLELVIQIESDEVGRLLIAIHKVHESLVSGPLEPHVLVE